MGGGVGYAVIVRRGEQDVFHSLQAQSRELGLEILWDRRVRDRRVVIRDVEHDRRRGERRGPTGPMWDALGFLVVRHSNANGHPVTAADACAWTPRTDAFPPGPMPSCDADSSR